MPNPTLKSLMLSASLGLCACEIPPGSDVYHPYSPPRPIGEAYNPAIKIEADPARFPLGGTISVNASVYNKSNTGPSPSAPQPGLQLRVVAADANGDYPALGGTYYPSANWAQPIGSQNWAHWSNATFTNVQVPAQVQKLAMIVNFATWSPVANKYLIWTDAGSQGVAIFRKSCIPINNTADCMWTKESG